METVDREALSLLARHCEWPSVSILMPMHRAGSDVQQDRIRLKNLLSSADEMLSAEGMRSRAIDDLMRPARDLLDDSAFWRRRGDGLAVFVSDDSFHFLRTDERVAEHVSVSDRFVIRPLVQVVRPSEHFYVLALSKNRVRVLEGTDDSVREIDLEGMPSSLAEVLKYDVYERNVQFHTRTPAAAAGGRRAAGFHGHGGVPDVEAQNLERYMRSIDRGLHDLLKDENAPLLLAGVAYLLAQFREVSSYPYLVAEALTGNPDMVSPQELHAETRQLLEPHFRQQLDRDVETLKMLEGTPAASSDLREIVPAAHEGRVKVLFVNPVAAEWGCYDPSNREVDLHDQRLPGDGDLADLATAETLLHGGTVHPIAHEGAEVQTAAIFRY